MAIINWHISQQPHGKFVTCQRPIVIEVRVTGVETPAFFRGMLWIEKNTNAGDWVETGITMNGYSDSSNGIFSFNVAEYCRQYFKEQECFYTQAWCTSFDMMLGRAFKLEIFPVKFKADGGLEPDPDDHEYTNSFIAVPTNTTVEESNSSTHDYIRVDKYVMNGTNSGQVSWPGSSFNRFTTNMPAYNVMDISQGFYFFLPLIHRGVNGRIGDMQITNAAGVTLNVPCLASNYTLHLGLHIHPIILDFWISLTLGVITNHLTDGSGLLTGNQMGVQIKYNNASTGAFIRSGPIQHYKLIDSSVAECSESKGTNFIFRNMLGNFDFFRATGTESKEINMAGTEFDRHTNFVRSKTQDFGVIRGQHNITNLWGNRTETVTVFSQPLNREQVKWIEEMIMSPQVWITNQISDWTDRGYANMGLVAINIIKGSYKLYSTDRKRSFIEFKYKFSESTLTQKM